MWATILLRTALVALAKAILKAALDEKALKPLIVDVLKHLASKTETNVDDIYVANIEKAMQAEEARLEA